MQTILPICMLLIIAGKIDWELRWSTVESDWSMLNIINKFD